MSNKAKKPLTEKQRKKRILIIAAIVTVVLLVASISAAIFYSNWRKDGGLERGVIAFETDNYEVNNCMLTYFYFTDLYSTYENYGPYLPYMSPIQSNPDMTSSLNAQYYDDGVSSGTSGTAQTWHEYFMNTTLSNVYGYLFYAEEALAQGFEHPELDKDVDEHIAKLTDDAKAVGLTLDEYLEKNYTSFVKEQDVRDALELQYYAAKYMEKVQDDYKASLTEDDYNAYKEENIATLETVDYYFFTLGNDVAEDATEEEKAAATAQAQSQSDDLLAKINEAADMDAKKAAFTDWVTTYLTEKNKAAAEPVSEEDLATDIASKTAENVDKAREDQLDFGKADNSDFGKWAYDEEHEAGEAAKFETGTGIYTVFLLTKPCSVDDSATKNVCHILITEDTYGSDEAAKAKAEEALEEYRNGEAGRENFEALAEKYNEDGSSFYENVTEGTMVTEFNDWIFDEARVEGDTDVVKTQYGYHVMYFVGEGVPTWKADAAESLVSTYMEEYGTGLQEKYEEKVDLDQEALWEVPDHLPAAAFTSSATDETTESTTDETTESTTDETTESTTDETTESATEETEAAEDSVEETTVEETEAQETEAEETETAE